MVLKVGMDFCKICFQCISANPTSIDGIVSTTTDVALSTSYVMFYDKHMNENASHGFDSVYHFVIIVAR